MRCAINSLKSVLSKEIKKIKKYSGLSVLSQPVLVPKLSKERYGNQVALKRHRFVSLECLGLIFISEIPTPAHHIHHNNQMQKI